MALVFEKEKGGCEDLLLDATSPSTEDQDRATGTEAITKINADTIPYSGTFNFMGMVSIKDKLDTKIGTDDPVVSLNNDLGFGILMGPGNYRWTGTIPDADDGVIFQVLADGTAEIVAKIDAGSEHITFDGRVAGAAATSDGDLLNRITADSRYILTTFAFSTPSTSNKVLTEDEVLSTLSASNLLVAQDDFLDELNEFTDTAISGSNKILTQADGGSLDQVMIVTDTRGSGTAGGTFTAGAWQTRDLNSEDYNNISGASLSSNRITLPSGTYEIDGDAIGYQVNQHQTRIYDITNGTAVGLGLIADQASGDQNPSPVTCVLTISGNTIIELQHRCLTTISTLGFGNPASWGDEVYSHIKIKKIG